MRDDRIINEILSLKKRNAAVYRQMVFCDTRLQAYDAVFQNAQWWEILFGRKGLMERVDKLHLELMNKHDEDLRNAQNSPPPQKLTIVRGGHAEEVRVNGHV